MVDNYGQRVVYLLRMVSTALNHELDRELRPFDLTRAQLGALSVLGLAHPETHSSAELARRAGVSAQAMSQALAGLLERKLVARTASPLHGRVLDVRITASGLRLLERVQVAMRRLEDRATAALDDAQEDELRDILRRMMGDFGLHLPPD